MKTKKKTMKPKLPREIIQALKDPYSELFSQLRDIVERIYHKQPLPGSPGDNGICHTSDEAQAAARKILETVLAGLTGRLVYRPGSEDRFYEDDEP